MVKGRKCRRQRQERWKGPGGAQSHGLSPGRGAERRRVSSIPNRWCLPLQPQLPALSDPGGPPPGLGKA